MKKRFSVIFLILVLMLTACSKKTSDNNTQQSNQTIVIRHFGDPMSWNPVKLPDDNGYPIFQNIFNRLVKLDSSKNIIPDLAESWDISDDAKKITFHLRKNAVWHDGEKVTADDVKYTFEHIKNSKDYFMSTKLNIVDEFVVEDENTISFILKSPDVALISHLGWYASFIVPKHIYDNGKSWDENEASTKSPIGSGPFKLEDYKQGESITLVKNEKYWEGSPKVDKLIYSIVPDDASAVQALVNGEIDVFENVPAANANELLQDNNLRLILNRYPSPIRIIFNMQNELVKQLPIREAIAYSIDREEISKKVFRDIQKPEYTMYPQLIEWVSNTTDTLPKRDVKESIKILEDAGFKKDADGYYIRGLVMECFEGNQIVDTAKIIKENLKEAGIELTLNIQEYNSWAEKVGNKKDYIMELQGGFMGPDPSALKERYGTGQASNWSQYSNSEFDTLVNKANETADQGLRADLYKKAQKILRDEVVFIPLVEFASYDANSVKYKNLPIDGVGKWGWQEYTFTEGAN